MLPSLQALDVNMQINITFCGYSLRQTPRLSLETKQLTEVVYISTFLTTDSDPSHRKIKDYPDYSRSRDLHVICSCCGTF